MKDNFIMLKDAENNGQKLHKIDRQILLILQQEGRISNQDLAEQVGISTASCWRRVKALEGTGVITRYTSLLNRESIGLDLCVFVHITLSRHNKQNTQNTNRSNIFIKSKLLHLNHNYIFKILQGKNHNYRSGLNLFYN